MAKSRIIQQMLNVTSETLTVKYKGDIENLKIAAASFLQGVDAVIGVIQKINDNLEQNSRTLIDIYTSMRDSTEITRKGIELQYLFEMNLNKFLGRQILLLYVDEAGDLIYADELIARNIYLLASKNKDKKGGGTGRGGNINIGKTRLQYLKDHPPKIVSNFQKQLKSREDFYKSVRDQVLTRWSKNHDPNNLRFYKDYKDTFYWIKNPSKTLIKQKYDWSDSINRGHIYETYTSLIWQQKELLTDLTQDEKGIAKYWIYMKEHNLNNVSGIAGGDISFFLNPNIQFAVKSGSFNTAAMGTYLNVAAQLLTQSDLITEQDVRNLLHKPDTYQDEVLKSAFKKAVEMINKEIEIKGE